MTTKYSIIWVLFPVVCAFIFWIMIFPRIINALPNTFIVFLLNIFHNDHGNMNMFHARRNILSGSYEPCRLDDVLDLTTINANFCKSIEASLRSVVVLV